ncbi:HAD-IIB family hydrolase [Candidatus Woesearchaeota archaeon]|nr:HAD-IIB family hydrolase [Candidatus Woesearchaeota archaeon]
MKIFFASQSFYPNIGGVSTYLLNLGRELQKRGHEVAEIHLRPSGAEAFEEVKGINVYRVPKEPLKDELIEGFVKFKESVWNACHGFGGFDREAIDMPGFREYMEINEAIAEQLDELLQKEPAEIVDIHDFQLLYLYKGIPRGTPLFLRWHIPFISAMPRHLKEFLINQMVEYDCVVFSSPEYVRNAVKAGLPREKTALLYPLANTKLFVPTRPNPEFKRKFGLERCKIILSAQRIDIKSGHEQLIRAMPYILRKVPDAKLVFVGGRSLTSKMSDIRKKYEDAVHTLIRQLKLQQHIVFTGTIPYDELPSVYACADVAALTSKIEGFGLAVTEAMACGKPVVGTDAGGIPLQIQDRVNGFLVGVDNIRETAGAIVKLLTNSSLNERMGQESLRIVQEKFSMSRIVEEHIMLYHRILGSKSDWGPRMMNLKDVNAFITDFDRTITDAPGKVNAKVIAELKSLKVPLVLVTGRPFRYVHKLYRKYPVWKCIVAENGAVIYIPAKDQLITFSSNTVRRAARLIAGARIKHTSGLNIISVPRKESAKVRKILRPLSKHLAYKYNVGEFMILPSGVDKGAGTKMALNHLNIDPEKTIIMGDAQNDVDLFNVPGYRIAVANAHKELKAVADHVTKNPCSAGVVEVIRELKE